MVRQWLACALFGPAIAISAPEGDLKPEDLMLARVRSHMGPMLERLPNYTCVQTIERFEQRREDKHPRMIDRVRLEVALVEGKELFSWPGKGRFEDREISEMVTGGAIGNGNFALHARSVFLGRNAAYTYLGERVRDDRRTLRWDFSVPQTLSGYNLRVGYDEAIVGYHGSFWVDPESLDAIRLEVRADNIPPRLGLQAASDTVEYARVAISGSAFLLPKTSELRLTDSTGRESVNVTKFASCRQYTGESVISFGDPEPVQSREEKLAPILLPNDLDFEVALAEGIDLTRAAVGDPVTFVAPKAVKKKGETVFPKNARFSGMFTMLRRQNNARGDYVIGIELNGVAFDGRKGGVSARLVAVPAALPGLATRSGSMMARVVSDVLTAGDVFVISGSVGYLPSGLRLFWRTKPKTSSEERP